MMTVMLQLVKLQFARIWQDMCKLTFKIAEFDFSIYCFRVLVS